MKGLLGIVSTICILLIVQPCPLKTSGYLCIRKAPAYVPTAPPLGYGVIADDQRASGSDEN